MTIHLERLQHLKIRASNSRWIHSKILETMALYRCFEPDQHLFHLPIFTVMHRQLQSEFIWLNRLEQMAVFENKSEQHLRKVHFNPTTIPQIREQTDLYLLESIESIDLQRLDHLVNYQTIAGEGQSAKLFTVLMNYFNHQSYIRSHVIQLLDEAGLGLGFDDLLYPFSKNLEIVS